MKDYVQEILVEEDFAMAEKAYSDLTKDEMNSSGWMICRKQPRTISSAKSCTGSSDWSKKK